MTLITRAPLSLTGSDAAFESALRLTHAGQAHFAGSGPDGAACGQCRHFVRSKPGSSTGRCAMFRRLAGKNGPIFPQHALPCRHFECCTTIAENEMRP